MPFGNESADRAGGEFYQDPTTGERRYLDGRVESNPMATSEDAPAKDHAEASVPHNQESPEMPTEDEKKDVPVNPEV